MNARLRRFLKLFLIVLVLLVPSLTVMDGVSAAACTTGSLSQPTGFTDPFNPAAPQSGYIAQAFSSLRSAPAGPIVAIVYVQGGVRPTFTVIGGPECVNNHTWLNIRYTSGSHNGQAGWALESQTYFDGTYGPGRWLAQGTPPVAPTPVPTPTTPTAAACAADGSNTPFSNPTKFAAATSAAPVAGRIGLVFSTWRPSIGAADYLGTPVYKSSNPTLQVLGTQASGGFCWLRVRYTANVPASILNVEGWALESQVFFDGRFGPGAWIIP